MLALLHAGSAAAETIADLASQVSQTNIEAQVAALEGEREGAAQLDDAAAYIRAQLESYGYQVESREVLDSENLIAEITGTLRPNEIFIVGAHYDTVENSPGADDNASGVAGMLEAARVLAGSQFESSLQFVAFTLEEPLLIGSRQLAREYDEDGATTVKGMLSLEMIGYTCAAPCQLGFVNLPGCLSVSRQGVRVGDYIGVVGNESSAALLFSFEVARVLFVPTLPTLRATVAGAGSCFPDTRRSDHAPFWDRGFPALMLTDTANFRNPNYHAPTDTADTLDYEFAAQVTRTVVANAAAQAVLLPEPRPDLAGWLALAGLIWVRGRHSVADGGAA